MRHIYNQGNHQANHLRDGLRADEVLTDDEIIVVLHGKLGDWSRMIIGREVIWALENGSTK